MRLTLIILLVLGLVAHVAGGGVFNGGTLMAGISAVLLTRLYTQETP